MTWLEKGGYLLVLTLFGLFAGSFVYKVDDYISAEAVPVTAAATKIAAADRTLVVTAWPQDFAQVKQGDRLLEIVEGEPAIRQFLLWQAVQASQKAGDAAVKGLIISKPATKIVSAPSAGVFRLEVKPGDLADDKAELAKVVDYNHLQLEGTFKGETVGAAKAGEVARITNVTIPAEGDTIIHGNSPEGPMLSRSIATDKVRKALEDNLKGTSVRLRDDIPLQITAVSSVEVDASLSGAKSNATGQILDPPADMKFDGTVLKGDHKAEVQIAALPESARKAADAALSQILQGKIVNEPNGSPFQISGVGDPNYVVKAKATVGTGGAGQELKGSSLSRSFNATVEIGSPPPYLIDKVREADKAGKVVTAKVEIKTGSRPIAFTLLRRS